MVRWGEGENHHRGTEGIEKYNYGGKNMYQTDTNENHYPGKILETGIEVIKPGHKYKGLGLTIEFQDGPIQENGVNGTTNEAVLDVLIDRLDYFQTAHRGGKFACRENAVAKTKAEESQMWLQKRTAKRVKQGIEGKDISHKS